MTSNREALSPEEFVAEIEANNGRTSRDELKKLTDHAGAWAVVYYDGMVPQDLGSRIERMQTPWA